MKATPARASRTSTITRARSIFISPSTSHRVRAVSDAHLGFDHLTAAGPSASGDLALVLTGGGARGAYQAGVLRGLARHFPGLSFPILAGVSAGAINASFLAAHPGTLAEATEELYRL